MAGKVYEIAFKIAGQMSGGFSKSFASANKVVKQFGGNLNELNAKAHKLDGIIKMRQEVGLAGREYYQAKEKLKELGKQIHATKNPSEELKAAFEEQQKATTKAKQKLNEKKESLRNIETAAGTTGQSIMTLVQRQKELADSAEKARAKLEKQCIAHERGKELPVKMNGKQIHAPQKKDGA